MKRFIAIFGIWILAAAPALATLTARVTPGYQFSATERPANATLNLLATPTITIYGTVDGTTGLTPGSVSGAMLGNDAIDGITLGWKTIIGGRAIEVQAAGLVNTNSGIIPSGTTTLRVYADTNYFTMATNSIASTNSTTGSATNWLTLRAGTLTDTNLAAASVKPNKLTPDTTNNATGWLVFSNGTGTVVNFPANYGFIRPDGTNLTVAATNWFTLTNVAFSTAAGLITNTAHNLGAVPGYVKWVAVCLTNDVGYEVGDEVNTSDFDGGTPPYFIGGANATNVFIVSSGGGISVANKYTGARGTSLTAARWRLKCYARP